MTATSTLDKQEEYQKMLNERRERINLINIAIGILDSVQQDMTTVRDALLQFFTYLQYPLTHFVFNNIVSIIERLDKRLGIKWHKQSSNDAWYEDADYREEFLSQLPSRALKALNVLEEYTPKKELDKLIPIVASIRKHYKHLRDKFVCHIDPNLIQEELNKIFPMKQVKEDLKILERFLDVIANQNGLSHWVSFHSTATTPAIMGLNGILELISGK